MLAYLMDGPKSQDALNGHVPTSVLEHLGSAGMIKRKMVRHGAMATACWYMADEEAPGVPVQTVRRCDHSGIFDAGREH